jgi:hypothetical protein
VSPFKPVIPLMPIVDVMVVGKPLTEVVVVGVVVARDVVIVVEPRLVVVEPRFVVVAPRLVMAREVEVVVGSSRLAGRSVTGIVIRAMAVAGIMLFMDMRMAGIPAIVLLMDMGCCMLIMGIIILGAPPGGLAAALPRSPKRAQVARTARAVGNNVRDICLSPS